MADLFVAGAGLALAALILVTGLGMSEAEFLSPVAADRSASTGEAPALPLQAAERLTGVLGFDPALWPISADRLPHQ